MKKIYFFDTISIIKNAGGVLNVSESLKINLKKLSLDVEVVFISEVYEELIKLLLIFKLNRFFIETIVYNWICISCILRGQEFFSIFPNYFLPFYFYSNKKRNLVVVHDLQFKDMPENFSRLKRIWLHWSLYRLSKSSSKIVFISQFCKDKFFESYGLFLNSTVILNPVEVETDINIFDSELSLNCKSRYMIASYHFYPHKNFPLVLNLFKKMKDANLVDDLYITGTGKEKVDAIAKEILGIQFKSVFHLGLVARQELMRLYKKATVFSSLSKYEGFNLSAAEAATLGTPLILSDIPVHRELFSDFAIFLESSSIDAGLIEGYLNGFQVKKNTWRYSSNCSPNIVAHEYLFFLGVISNAQSEI